MISTPSMAEVIDPVEKQHTKEGMLQDGLVPAAWLLVQETTLRSIKKDADGYKLTLVKLTEAQEDLNRYVKITNQLQLENFEFARRLALATLEIERPPWYKSNVFWCSVGFIAGGVVVAYAAHGI